LKLPLIVSSQAILEQKVENAKNLAYLENFRPGLLVHILNNLTWVDRVFLSFCSSTLRQSSEWYDRMVTTDKKRLSLPPDAEFLLLIDRSWVK
jgi:hypothetical protein